MWSKEMPTLSVKSSLNTGIDLGVTLAEVVEHDKLCVHLHPDADGLRRGAATHKAPTRRRKNEFSAGRTLTQQSLIINNADLERDCEVTE